MSSDQRFAQELPDPVSKSLNQDAATHRAIITILIALARIPDLRMSAWLGHANGLETVHPIMEFTLENEHLFMLQISCANRIFFRFANRHDANSFMDCVQPFGALHGRDLAANPAAYPMYFESMVAVRAREFDYSEAGNHLVDILNSSPALRLLGRDTDTPMQALLRRFNRPHDEQTFDEIVEQILDGITAENFDFVLDSLEKFDPEAEQDPVSVPRSQLILIADLVCERRYLLRQSRRRLRQLKETFSKLGIPANAQLIETNGLLRHIDETLQDG